jgi:hypothetical protein
MQYQQKQNASCKAKIKINAHEKIRKSEITGTKNYGKQD